jgi:hypothetical protein
MTMTNRPILPPLRAEAASTGREETRAAADVGCTILDHCDQCGRRIARPHVSNGRAYCGACCPTCARAASASRSL